MKQRIQLKSLIVFQSDAPRHLRRDFRGLFMMFLSLAVMVMITIRSSISDLLRWIRVMR